MKSCAAALKKTISHVCIQACGMRGDLVVKFRVWFPYGLCNPFQGNSIISKRIWYCN